jgi:CheY-like chemotaxis protein
MVHGIVTQSGGSLILKSSKGAGTTVELWFPLEKMDAKPAGTAASPQGVSGGIRLCTVLAVDDDSLVLTNMVAMLEDLGHTVLQSSSGKAALEILRGETAIDLMVTDQAMPEMTGTTLIATAREAQPSLRVILVTGYDELPRTTSGDLVKLAKPFRQDDLVRAIADTFRNQPRNHNVLTFPRSG